MHRGEHHQGAELGRMPEALWHIHRYEKMKQQYEAIETEWQRWKEQCDRISTFSSTLAEQTEIPIEFNNDLCG